MKDIQVYADSVKVIQDRDGVRLDITGVDTAHIAAEFSADDLLDQIEPATIADYLAKRNREQLDE